MGIVQRQSIQLTIISYAGAVLGMVNNVFLLTNFLSTDQVGLTNVLRNVALLYAQFAALGINNIGIRFFPYFENKEKKHHGFLFWGNTIVFGGFVLITVMVLLFKPLIVKNVDDPSHVLDEYYSYLVPLALAMVYFQFFDTYLRALLKTVVATFISELLGRILITVCIALYALKFINFHQFVIVFVASNFILTALLVVYMIFLGQLHIKPVRSPLFKRMFKSILMYGVFTILGSIGAAILRSIDSIMVTGMLNLSLAGIYTTIFNFPTIISLPWRSLQRATYPLIARHWRKKEMKKIEDLYQKTTTVNMVIGGLLFLGIWANIDSIFTFMPKDYSSGRYVFLLLGLATYTDMITGLNGIIMITSKKYKYDLWFMFLLIGLTIISNLVFIPIWGITGAAIAAAGSVIIYNIVRLIFVKAFFKMQPFTLNCLWILLITIAAWLVSLLIPQTGNRYINIVLNSSIITAVYMAPTLLFKLSPDVNKMAYNFTKLKFLKPKEDTIISS